MVPLLNRYRDDIPLELLLGWIQKESGGRLGRISSLDERGYFQVHPDESDDLKLDHERLSKNRRYSVKSGIKLVKYYARFAEKRLRVTHGTDLFWHVVKFLHAMGMGAVKTLIDDMRENGVESTTWEEIKQYAADNRKRLRRLYKKKYGKTLDAVKWTKNVDEVFKQGRQLAGK